MSVRDGFYVAPEVEAACLMLERHGALFGFNFSLNNAISKAAKLMTDLYDNDEHGCWT